MVDLSDVIGKAVGGEEGQLLDTLIDMMRRYRDLFGNIKYTDTEVVSKALYDLAYNIESYTDLSISVEDLAEAINRVNEKIEDARVQGYEMR